MREINDVSVVMPALNEEKAIGEVVEDTKEIEFVEEVVVVDNDSEDKTAQIARERGARVLIEEKRGYGYAMKKALEESECELVISIESDQSYEIEDIEKLVAYSKDFDVVVGDRTNKALIEEGAKMGFMIRYGNKFLGRLIQILFGGPRITDVGCSYKAFRRNKLELILEEKVGDPNMYSPQILIACAEKDIDFIQIPVRYKEREGNSKLTKDRISSLIIGLKMTYYILIKAFKSRF